MKDLFMNRNPSSTASPVLTEIHNPKQEAAYLY